MKRTKEYNIKRWKKPTNEISTLERKKDRKSKNRNVHFTSRKNTKSVILNNLKPITIINSYEIVPHKPLKQVL